MSKAVNNNGKYAKKKKIEEKKNRSRQSTRNTESIPMRFHTDTNMSKNEQMKEQLNEIKCIA